MPHYIWQSNLFLIISVEPRKENAISPSSPQIPIDPKESYVFCFSQVSFVLFLLDFLKFQQTCSSESSNSGAAF